MPTATDMPLAGMLSPCAKLITRPPSSTSPARGAVRRAIDALPAPAGGVEPEPEDAEIGRGHFARRRVGDAQIFTGKLGGMPWEVLGPTAEVVGLVKAKITIEGSGRKSTFRAEGVGEGRGDTFKNPVTGEEHLADVHLPSGFIWKKGECGQGSFRAAAAGLSVASEKTNWIYYSFDWSNG